MKCQNCGKNEANTHLKQNINGSVSECYICSDCAEKLGYGGIFSGFGDFGSFGSFGGFGGFDAFDSIIGSLFGDTFGRRAISSAARCKTCGSTFNEIAHNGKVGCADCYDTFRNELMPSIKRMHGNVKHIGKHSEYAAESAAPAKEGKDATPDDKQSRIRELKAQMERAVEKQDYEQAAVLRDKIKELEALK